MSPSSPFRGGFRRPARSRGHSRGRAVLLTTLVTLALALSLEAGPNRYGHSDRVERHMLPAVSTGPMDPAWSPDGRWIAFSMRGDIWKVPAEGGEATALTRGPAYHFEPAWSPDGRWVALTMDVEGNLDVGLVSADGGQVSRITYHPQVDVQPEWSPDGGSLYFASARGSGFRIFRKDLSADTAVEITSGFQPAVAPDGTQLAYVDGVRGRLGSGGLWVRSLVDDSEPTLVHYEETEYRMKPAWTPDGRAFLFVSEERGSNDVVTIPAAGGSPVVLTPDGGDELSPATNPVGNRFAFVSNRGGPTTLYTAEIGGGPFASWAEVPITSRSSRAAVGRIRGRVVGEDGSPLPARVHLTAGDGRSYAPDGGFHRVISVTETHYFHTGGAFEVEVPAGTASLEVLKGHEFRPASTTLEVPANGIVEVELRPTRLVDLPSQGWWSGDTHLHDLHQGRYGLTHDDFFLQTVAEDLHVANALIHMDGTRLMGRWEDLTGEPHPLSTSTHLLQYGEEFRGSLGHVAMIGIGDYIMPLIGGTGGTAYGHPVLDLPYLDGARDQGGIAGFVHPFLNAVDAPSRAASSLIPLDVALGRGDFYDVAAVYSDELASTDMYYRLLNVGFRIPATGGTDNFSDVWRDPPPGTDRTYVNVQGPLSVQGWVDGIRAGRTFASTGPLLLLDVEGRGPGDEIQLAPGAPSTVGVRARLYSITRVDSVEIIVNGLVAAAMSPSDPSDAVLEAQVEIPEGGWIAARARGPSSRYVSDSYAFAQTSPVYVVRAGRRWTSPEDARFLSDAVAALWARLRSRPWSDVEERNRFQAAVDEALAVYKAVAEG